MVRTVEWAQETADRARVTVHLRAAPYGYLVLWENNALVLKLRGRPRHRSRNSPLRGLTIAVDPGHPPVGATGPTGLWEPQVTLPIGLQAAGAPRAARRARRDDAHHGRSRRAGRSPGHRAARQRARVRLHPSQRVSPTASTRSSRPARARTSSAPTASRSRAPCSAAWSRSIGLQDLGVNYNNLAVVRGTWYPAVLCEGAFLMLPDQEAALRTPEFQERYARGVADGLESYFRTLGHAVRRARRCSRCVRRGASSSRARGAGARAARTLASLADARRPSTSACTSRAGFEREGRVAAAAAERAYERSRRSWRGRAVASISCCRRRRLRERLRVRGRRRNRIVLFATPPIENVGLRLNEDWLALLVTHELTHIFHLDRTRGIWRVAQTRVRPRARSLSRTRTARRGSSRGSPSTRSRASRRAAGSATRSTGSSRARRRMEGKLFRASTSSVSAPRAFRTARSRTATARCSSTTSRERAATAPCAASWMRRAALSFRTGSTARASAGSACRSRARMHSGATACSAASASVALRCPVGASSPRTATTRRARAGSTTAPSSTPAPTAARRTPRIS